MTQTPRDWKKDMEMCEAATPGPWKYHEPFSIRSAECENERICGYAEPNNAEFIVEARESLPYWLQEAKVYKQSYEATLTQYTADKFRANAAEEEVRYQKGVTEDYAKGYRLQELRAMAAEAREQRLKEEIETALRLFDMGESAMVYEILESTLTTLYPDTPAPKEGSND